MRVLYSHGTSWYQTSLLLWFLTHRSETLLSFKQEHTYYKIYYEIIYWKIYKRRYLYIVLLTACQYFLLTSKSLKNVMKLTLGKGNGTICILKKPSLLRSKWLRLLLWALFQIFTCVTVEVGMASRGGRGASSASGPRTARACPAPARRGVKAVTRAGNEPCDVWSFTCFYI